MSKKRIDKSDMYIWLIKVLDNDDTFITFFNMFPFRILQYYVPINYLSSRYDDLKKKGKL